MSSVPRGDFRIFVLWTPFRMERMRENVLCELVSLKFLSFDLSGVIFAWRLTKCYTPYGIICVYQFLISLFVCRNHLKCTLNITVVLAQICKSVLSVLSVSFEG